MTRPTITPTAAALRERDRHIANAHIGGATFEALGRQFNITASTAYRGYQRYMAQLATPDDVEHYRELQLARLEQMHMSLWNQALGTPGAPGQPATPPDLEAVGRLLQIHDRVVRLLGLHREIDVPIEEDLRRMARQAGLDEEEILRDAEAVIAQNSRRFTSRRI